MMATHPDFFTAPLEIVCGGNFSSLETVHGNLKSIHKDLSRRFVGFEILSHIRIEVHEDIVIVLYPITAIINSFPSDAV
jgi:hypothetical protein